MLATILITGLVVIIFSSFHKDENDNVGKKGCNGDITE